MPLEKYFSPLELPTWMELVEEPVQLSAYDLRKRQIHRIFSIKAGLKPIIVKANLRADATYLFESDTSIAKIEVRPAVVPLKAKGKKKVVMDFSVRYLNGDEELILMVYKKSLVESENESYEPPHWSAVHTCCKAAGRRSRFITDIEIKKGTNAITNSRRLLPLVRISRVDPRPDISVCVFEAVSHTKSITINELRSVIPGKYIPRIEVEVADLLHRGKIRAQLNKKLFSSNTPVKVDDNDQSNL